MRANDAPRQCAVHPVVPELPFGGVGTSGMGKYHGHWGFEAFTDARGVLCHCPFVDPALKYPPYAKHKRGRKVEMKLLHRTSGFNRGSGRRSPVSAVAVTRRLPIVGRGPYLKQSQTPSARTTPPPHPG
jgi:hypothetical protein